MSISISSKPLLAPELIAPKWLTEFESALRDLATPEEGCPAVLSDAILHSLLAPCKRLRPTLVMLATDACNGDVRAALPAACAVEMIHTYSLIHDDLPAMDDDDMRRGRPSCHAAFGEANAILAGDALLTRAFEVLATQVHPASHAAACCAELAKAAGAIGMVGGQVDDLMLQGTRGSLEQLEGIHRRKTAALIAASATIGGIIAAASTELCSALACFGQKIGLAFQIVDDLLDLTSSAEQLGKRTKKDAIRGKLTYPGLIGVEGSRRKADELLDEACRALAPLGPRNKPLLNLAQYVSTRVQ